MKLFAGLYLDEDVSVLMAELLKPKGFDVLTARDAGMLTKSDEHQLAYATEHGRAILTHNRDHFQELHQAWLAAPRPHAGIIIATRRDIYALANRVATLLNTLTADEIENQLLYI